MPNPRIEYAVLPAGEGPGQDRCFIADGLVVILDGASAYDPTASPDASEYVDTLGPALIEQITGTPGIDLRAALAEAIRQTAHKLALVPGQGPSSTVSIVRWGDEAVDVLVLGDSPVVVHCTNGSQKTIVQHPMDHIAPELRRRYRERLVAGHGYDDEHRQILAELQRREAPLRNRDDGYWIAEATAVAANSSTIHRTAARDTDYAVVMSDGVSNSVLRDEAIRSASWSNSSQLLNLLRRIHQWERLVDPNGQSLPRSKTHDDKAIACLIIP